MIEQSATIIIARSPGDVFAYMDDVSREVEWQPSLESATQDPPGPTTLGSRKHYVSRFMGRRVENTYVVVELDPGRSLVCQTEKGSTVDARSELSLEPVASGTLVTLSMRGKPGGMLRFLPTAVLEAAYREELEASLGRLKARLEEEAQGLSHGHR